MSTAKNVPNQFEHKTRELKILPVPKCPELKMNIAKHFSG